MKEKIHPSFSHVITETPEMVSLLLFLSRVAATDASVLLLGETGTGKDILARSLHHASNRCNGPLVTINCAAIPENLLESELFGYKRGAFTDAKDDRKGKLEVANGGTVFLDEIAELNLSCQAKILRIIEDKKLERLGDTYPVDVDVRIIAATNADLEQRIHSSSFRPDLFYRLNEVKAQIPPLRERKKDIPSIISYFVCEFNREFNKKVESISDVALSFLFRYDFPGNVRELRSIIKRAMIVAERAQIWIEDLPLDIRIRPEEDCKGGAEYLLSLKEWLEQLPIGVPIKIGETMLPSQDKKFPTLKEIEEAHILEALRKARENKSRAAELLGIDRSTLYQKLKGLTRRKN